ncbi:hypothetical protein WP9W18E04_04180 [Aeromonas veronii]|nr:hypothetical protein WP9W18E04_04180 [Aeromonas veronii]
MGYARPGEGAFAAVSERSGGSSNALVTGGGREAGGLLDVKDCWLWPQIFLFCR